MHGAVLSSTVVGVDGLMVEVEVDIAAGLPNTTVVGLGDSAVKESRDRVKAALKNSGYECPPRRITVNLAPADVRKEGSAFDLPIAIGVCVATGQLESRRLRDYALLGELSLDGRVKPIRGALPIAAAVARRGLRGLLLPHRNAAEAAVVEGLDVIPVTTLGQAFDFLRGEEVIEPAHVDVGRILTEHGSYEVDFREVKGQEHVKRALEVAACGGHNVIMVGPPGSGKTMLAKRLPTILPPLTLAEAIDATRVHSVVGLMRDRALVAARPFRAPHHTISDAGMIGGGVIPRPGEVSLAHHGVLFLDELPEFRKNVLEVLRQPLEERRITISRAAGSITYPANLMLIAAMNPCPCGFYGDPQKECTCATVQVARYRTRISGPLLDRIDIQIEVPAVRYRDLSDQSEAESSAAIRARVEHTRNLQLARFRGRGIYCNAEMSARDLRGFCDVEPAAEALIETAMTRLGLSARAYTRILKVARTIADLDGAATIGAAQVAEAIQYRSLDRSFH
jgi:magnesium chelatase family protein